MPNIVAIIGRPNVGKSTLFNRILGRRSALVHDRPGTTRDRNEARVSWKGREFVLIDTGGWSESDTVFSPAVRRQLEVGVRKSDLVILLVDGKEGCHPVDAQLAQILRRQGKKVLLVVNKIDTGKDEARAADFYRLGIDTLISISANHGRSVNELLDMILERLPESAAEEPEAKGIRLILVGKPNVGKSSLLNALCREERCIVHDIPGTTREALDIAITFNERQFILIDTPGLHRKRVFKDDMDYLSTLSAHHAMERADVAILVMDASQGIGETETKVAELIQDKRKACLFVMNKWDLVENREEAVKMVQEVLENKLKFMLWSKLLLVSAKTGQRTERILSEAEQVYREFTRRVPPDELTEVVRKAETRKPFARQGKMLRIESVEQVDTKPPTFVFRVNRPDLVHFSYRRYLENQMREAFKFTGTPITLRFSRAGGERKGRRS